MGMRDTEFRQQLEMALTYVAGFIARGDEQRRQAVLDFFAQFTGNRPGSFWKTGSGRRYWLPVSSSLEWEEEDDRGNWVPVQQSRSVDFRQLEEMARDCGYNIDPMSFYRTV